MTKEKNEQAGCCDSENFQDMIDKIRKNCEGKTVTLDCSTFIDAMMKSCPCSTGSAQSKKESSCC